MMLGQTRFGEKRLGELAPHVRRNIAVLPANIRDGTSFQLAFKMGLANDGLFRQPPQFVNREGP